MAKVLQWLGGNCRFAAGEYDEKAMVSPTGEIYPTDNHLEWSQANYGVHGIQFQPTKTLDYEETSDPEEALMDDNDRIALDAFKDEGWIRTQTGAGIELSWIGPHNMDLVKKILRDMARTNPGRTLYVDVGHSIHVPVSWTGRPDFSGVDAQVEQEVSRGGVTSSTSHKRTWILENCRFATRSDLA